VGNTIVPFAFLIHILAKNQTRKVLNCEIYLVQQTFFVGLDHSDANVCIFF